LTNKFVTV